MLNNQIRTSGMMTLTFSDPCNFNQLKLGLCLPPKPLHEYACTLSQFYWGDTVLGEIPGVLLTYCCSVQFRRSVVSDSLWPHGLQASLSITNTGVCSNSWPLSWWCHPTISPSVIPFFFHLQSFPVSRSFQMSQLFESGDQNIGVSASTSVLLMNTQD